MKIKFIIIVLLSFCWFNTLCQKRNAIWCFGDSALVDFKDTSNTITGTSFVKSRGSCISIADTSGQLLFYSFTRAGILGNTSRVYNSLNQIIQNGDSIVGEGWYNELTIFPQPGNDSIYYLFSVGVTGSSQKGLYYSKVNMNANSGLGEVIQKNVQLQNFEMVDCLTAIKHGNGRDWWVIFRKWNSSWPVPNNEYHIYLISIGGTANYSIQNIGAIQNNGFGNISFNAIGTRMAYLNYKGLLELFDFDRCTGILSNPETVYPENTQSPWPQRWSSAFSPSGDILYVSSIAAFSPDSCYLVQFDLTASNIAASADTLWRTPFMMNMGQLKLAPDGKIYMGHNFNGGYPYNDTTYNTFNMNLSVINSPDNLGAACDLQPYSFYLGGKRTYLGLPNNPDYDLGPVAGSICDTLVGLSPNFEEAKENPELHIYYSPIWQTAFINANKLKPGNYVLKVFDVQGRVVFEESASFSSSYYTKNLNCINFTKGIYLVLLQTEGERLVERFVVE